MTMATADQRSGFVNWTWPKGSWHK